MKKSFFLALSLSIGCQTSLLAANTSTPAAAATPKTAAPSATAANHELQPFPFPWHLTDTWFRFDKSMEPDLKHFNSLDLDFSINRDVTTNPMFRLYISPMGIAKINGVGVYGGVQTDSDGWMVSDLQAKKDIWFGKGAIFSRWTDNKAPVSLDFVRAAYDGAYMSKGNEGEFASARRPYDWKAGHYTYELIRMDYEKRKDGDSTWVGAFITNHETHERTFIGAARFPGKNLKLGNSIPFFVEIYGGKNLDISKLPPLEIRFGIPRVNGKRAVIKEADVLYEHGDKPHHHYAEGPQIGSVEASPDQTALIFKLHNQIIPRTEFKQKIMLHPKAQQ